MFKAVSNTNQATDRTPDVRLSHMVMLHPATITVHHIIWGKRVLAVPHDTSERLREHHS
jgi:hypothetical protein